MQYPKDSSHFEICKNSISSQEVCSLTVRDFKSKDFLRKWDLAGATINKIS